MFLLIQTGKQGNICAFITFTFHNVSINTTLLRILLSHTPDFTFHNVSINTVAQSETTPMEEYPLHSTMFLLIPWFLFRWCKMLLTLHSTMFLLILWQLPRANISDITLHSTMFLLIRGSTTGIVTSVSSFTFHNVSINTRDDRARYHRKKTLHSTMFLLILLDSLFCAFGYLLYIPQCFY